MFVQDEAAFDKRKVKSVINLSTIDRVFVGPCPPDEMPTSPEHVIGERAMHVVLKKGQTYVFSDDWSSEVNAALERNRASQSQSPPGSPAPDKSVRKSASGPLASEVKSGRRSTASSPTAEAKGVRKSTSGRLSIMNIAASPKAEKKVTV